MKALGALLLALLIGCTGRPVEVAEEDGQPDTALASLKETVREMDSLERLPTCERVWLSYQGDSLWNCSDPLPPAAPKKAPGQPMSPLEGYFPGMPDFWKPGRSFQADEAIDAHAYLQELHALPDNKLDLVAVIQFGPPTSRQKAGIARRVQAWRKPGADRPFR